MAMVRMALTAHRGVSCPILERLPSLWSPKCTYMLGIPYPIQMKKEQRNTVYRNCNIVYREKFPRHYPLNFFCKYVTIECWSCKTRLGSYAPFCSTCKSLQPIDHSLNYFEVLGIEKVFNVDTKSLTRTFRLLQTQFHPDKFSLRAENEQKYALEHSSAINKAYRSLLHPVERALYLLELAGQPLHEGQVTRDNDDNDIKISPIICLQIDMDPEFLMEIMEVNEDLDEASGKDAVWAIGQRNQEILDGLLSEADAAFSANDIETARKVVAKIKYYNNIYEKVQEYEREHGIFH